MRTQTLQAAPTCLRSEQRHQHVALHSVQWEACNIVLEQLAARDSLWRFAKYRSKLWPISQLTSDHRCREAMMMNIFGSP